MEKNKNRSDMIKAGRQRLEQFRQKKDGKGGSSQGKSSKKSGKSEKREVSAGVASATAKKPTSVSHAESHSMENSSASEVDIGVQDSEGEMTHAQVKLEPTANIEGVTVIQARGDQVADVGAMQEANGSGSEQIDRSDEGSGKPDDNLAIKLAESENLVASLQLENSKFSGVLASLQEEKKQIENEKEQLMHEYEKALMESDKHKCLVTDLQVENSSLIQNVSSLTEEKDRLEEDKKRTADEVEKLSSELFALQEQSSNERGARLQVEADLKEAMVHLDQLTKENVHLTSSLDIHRSKIREIDGVVDDKKSSKNIPEQDPEAFSSSTGKFLSDSHERRTASELSVEEYLNSNSGFVVLKGHLEEAEKVLLKLGKEVDEMHSRSASHNKPGGKVAKPAISHLIKAFESKPPGDEEPQERTEDRLLQDSYDLARKHAEELRSVLKQLVLDVDSAVLSFEREVGGRNRAEVALGKLNVQFEALKEHNSILEASNIELGVSYEVIKNYVSEIENKNTGLEALCESWKQQELGHKAENSDLVAKLSASQSRISELESELLNLKNQSDEQVSRVHELETELLKLQHQSDEMVSRVGELESELHKTQHLSDEKASKINELESELHKTQHLSDEKASRVNELETELHKTQHLSDEKASRINELETELHEMKYLSDERVSRINELEGELLKLQHQADVSVSRISELESKVLKFEDESDKKVSKIGELESELLKLQYESEEKVSKIGELETLLLKLQNQSDEQVSSIYHQLKAAQNETSERALQLDREWSSSVSQINETLQNLDDFICMLFPMSASATVNNPTDIVGRVVASVYGTTKVLEDAWEKLQAAGIEYEALRASHQEMTERFKSLHGSSEINMSILHRLQGELKNLVTSSGGLMEESEMSMLNEDLLYPVDFSHFKFLLERLKSFVDERLQLLSVNDKPTTEIRDPKEEFLDQDAICELVEDIANIIKLEETGFKSDEPPVLRLQLLVPILVRKYKETDEKLELSMKQFEDKLLELTELQERVQHFSILNLQQDNEIIIIKESLRQAEEALAAASLELQEKAAELELSEQRVSSIREKLSIAVAKGKGLVVQRDNLKQSLAETTNELERCSEALQITEDRLREVEAKLKTYSEAGERVEALESELSYIRHSATALRESFLLKDSVLQRIEEILEDLDLPEHFHSRGIIEKIEWLARSVTGSSNLVDWDHKSSMEGGSYSEAGYTAADAWKEDVQASSSAGDDLRRRFEDLQGKFYGLAEQNEMLEQSLMERNNLVQRWEELLNKVDMPVHLRSMEPVDRIEWLGTALSEAYHDRNSLLEKIDKLENNVVSLATEFDGYKKQIADLGEELLNKDNMPLHLRSMEPVDRIQWLGTALSEAYHDRNSLLEKIDKLENNVVSLTTELDGYKRQISDLVEELLNNVDMPLHLRSMEPPVDSIRWLGTALSEAHHDRNSLLEKIDKLENNIVSLATELDGYKRQIADLEAELQENSHERERISESLEALIYNQDKLSAKTVLLGVENERLQDEVAELLEKLTQKQCIEKQVLSMNGDIKRMQELIIDAVQDPGTNDMVSDDGNTACLEALVMKLIEGYRSISSGKHMPLDVVADEDVSINYSARSVDSVNTEDPARLAIRKELDETLDELKNVKEERDSYLEKQQSVSHEVEMLNRKVMELQELLSQEEQKTGSLREKLNVAVRKGKSLVQHRDSLKQTIEEMNAELERLKSDLSHHVSALADYEQKVKMLSSYPERVEILESENIFLRNRLSETEHHLQENGHTLNSLLHTLNEIDFGGELNITDPMKKLEQLGRLHLELSASVASSEQEAAKSKRAAELLLAELNEVQERNDGLQGDLEKAASEIAELSRRKNEAEAANADTSSRLNKLSTAYNVERVNHLRQLMPLKSGIEQFKKGFCDISDQLNNVFCKNLEFLHSLEAAVESCLNPNLPTATFKAPIIAASGILSQTKDNPKFMESQHRSDGQDLSGDNDVTEISRSVGHHLQEIMAVVVSVKERLDSYSISLHQQSCNLSKGMEIVYREVTSRRESDEEMKRNIMYLESSLKDKNSEITELQRNLALLYDACAGSILEIETGKPQMIGNDLVDGLHTEPSVGQGPDFTGHGNGLSAVKHMAERLRMMVKEFSSTNAKLLEGSQKEMKITIANLQKELQEKDIQKDRISVEFVSQIKEAEAAANSYLSDLQSAKKHLQELNNRVKTMEEERNLQEQKVKELQDQQAILTELQDKIRTLTELVAGKDQEIESLMQALDEEEAQMEDLTNKVQNLEEVVQQKNLELENLEASRGKVMKKLSVTVGKFDELHNLSESLLAEVENLQSQLQERDSEISFLRQEVTRCTNEVLNASQMSSKISTDEIQDFLTWLDTSVSMVGVHDDILDPNNISPVQQQKEVLQKKITAVLSELEHLRVATQSKDTLLQEERSKVEELTRKEEMLEKLLHEKESQYGLYEDVQDSGQPVASTSEIVEIEPLINKWTVSGTSPQVRSLRKVNNNDQVAIAIDADADNGSQIADEDDDKVHGFKSLTTSRIVPRFTRPVSDMLDGLWVSCDRALMRQPALRLAIILYWGLLHAMLATFVV